jgi:hypothetical protein
MKKKLSFLPVVGGEWDLEIVELFFVFVNVHSEPAPVAVRIVVVVVSIESEIKTIKLRSLSNDLIAISSR